MKRLVRVHLVQDDDQRWYVLICFPSRRAVPKLLKGVAEEDEAEERRDQIVQMLRELDEEEDRRLAQAVEQAVNVVFAD